MATRVGRRAGWACAVGVVIGAWAGPAAAEGDAPPPERFEGAVGLVATWRPEYSGADRHSLSLVPAGFIRYGRITISGAGGFTTRRDDDVERGLTASLIQREHFKLGLALRYDPGRRESSSASLAGMGDIGRTVRARLLLRWKPDEHWTLSASSSLDALGSGGGYVSDVGLAREWRLSPRSTLQLGTTVTFAGDQYLQTWYGVTPAQAARSGYTVYQPEEGMRDVAAGLTLRTEFSREWAGFVGFSASRLVGAAARSPLVKQPGSWTASSGLAWRF